MACAPRCTRACTAACGRTPRCAQPDEECLGDLGVTWHEQRERMAELGRYLATALDPRAVEHVRRRRCGHSPRGDGGALLYLIETPDGSVLYQDTSGHWTGIVDQLRPDVAIIAAAGRANVDGEPVQGSLGRFVADQAARVGARRVVLAHHDNWLPGFSAPTDLPPIRATLAAHAPGCELLELGYVDHTIVLP